MTTDPSGDGPLKAQAQHELAHGISLQPVQMVTVGPACEDDQRHDCEGKE